MAVGLFFRIPTVAYHRYAHHVLGNVFLELPLIDMNGRIIVHYRLVVH